MGDAKLKPAASLRVPKPKKKLGLSVPPALRLPHDDLIFPANELQSSPESNNDEATLPSQTTLPSLTRQGMRQKKQELPVAPERDFSKVANSIVRQALPAGLFAGKSKQLYDCLYSLTRGAVVPSRVVRISRPKLMKKSGIGSRITFDTNIERLVSVGLIQVKQIPGEHEGNEYAVLMPEEVVSSMPSQTRQGSLTSLTSSAQKLDRLVRLETRQTSQGSSPDESTVSEEPKTFFKTIDDDTHTLAGFCKVLLESAHSVVGGELIDSEQERERWKELGQILADELRSAAQNTKAISSVPAFLAAHLRRRLARRLEAQPAPDKALEPVRTEGGAEVSTKSPHRATRGEAKSKFSIEECRRYAEHLQTSGQGITNPGGYATTIHRTGEADELIEKFLNPPIPSASTDFSQCPDCHGTGWWYPKGPEMGVARCKHERFIGKIRVSPS